MFLIAYRQELGIDVDFPAASHWIELPPGYQGSRAVALKLLPRDLFVSANRYKAAPGPNPSLPPAVTATDAIGDLPTIDARKLLAAGLLSRGARRFNVPVPLAKQESLGDFAQAMRNWPGYEAGPALYDHVIRYLPRDYALFARLSPGDQYPEAHAMAGKMFEQKLARLTKLDRAPRKNSKAWTELRKETVPPYDPTKFPNKWRKMEPDKPARTLMAHLGKDSYSHIHYDSSQARPISVREAARLQSFPDGFKFSGTMNPAFRQIGNAVPPLLARCIAERLVSCLMAGISSADGDGLLQGEAG
jgi:DNA (cytosine-5)-methyltransferase 1